MLVMVKKRVSKMGRPPKAPGRKSLHARVSDDIFQALHRFAIEYNLTHPYTEKASHVEIAVREYLERNGFWPPRPPTG